MILNRCNQQKLQRGFELHNLTPAFRARGNSTASGTVVRAHCKLAFHLFFVLSLGGGLLGKYDAQSSIKEAFGSDAAFIDKSK